MHTCLYAKVLYRHTCLYAKVLYMHTCFYAKVPYMHTCLHAKVLYMHTCIYAKVLYMHKTITRSRLHNITLKCLPSAALKGRRHSKRACPQFKVTLIMALLTADPYSESLVAESPRPRSWEVDAMINVKLVYTFQGYIECIVHIITCCKGNEVYRSFFVILVCINLYYHFSW